MPTTIGGMPRRAGLGFTAVILISKIDFALFSLCIYWATFSARSSGKKKTFFFFIISLRFWNYNNPSKQ
jgi:hypothetical protein